MESTTSRKSRFYYGGLLLILFSIGLLNSSFDTLDTSLFLAMVTDSDGDGIPDHVDIDDDNDGIVDENEDFNLDGDNDPATHPSDTDNDGIPNYLDVDSDNDGIIDNLESQTTSGYVAPSGHDVDGNGLDDNYEETPGSCGGIIPIDTDVDGQEDYIDIDSDNDGILDNREAQSTEDFIAPCGIDSDGNGLDDHYEAHPGACGGLHPIDSDNDSFPDYRDIDSDNDGIPDNVEGQTTFGYVPPTGMDDDNDGLDNAYEGAGDEGITPVNTDGTDQPDYRDDDTDNDLVADNNEGNDFNFDGQPDQQFTGTDTDGDGLDDGYEGSDVNDGFDVNDEIDDPANDLPDTDGTEDVNYRDIDDDGDGMDTSDEDTDGDGDPTNDDGDNDDTPNYLDPDPEMDSDGDGVPDGDELDDGTDPLDPCDFVLADQSITPTAEWDALDCDGDGVTNGDELDDGTDPLDPCDFILANQTVTTTDEWNSLDCDGDGVTNGDEVGDGTDPLDSCDLIAANQTEDPTDEWNSDDCDNDGNPNGTDPNPLTATAVDDEATIPALSELVLNVLENDDFLPNNDPNNLGTTTITQIGGNATGTIAFDPDTGELSYTPPVEEINTEVTIVYEACNIDPDPDVCDSATVTISVTDGPLPELIANNDVFSEGLVDGSIGGIVPDSNVLDNDTLDGVAVDPDDVILTSTPTGPLTINPDGTVTVASGTENGSYIIEYTICEVANPDNCDSATTSVLVGPNTIEAVDDDFSDIPIDGMVGGIVPDRNVLDNDTLNELPVNSEDVTLTSDTSGPILINPDGTVEVAVGTEDGLYTVEYTICENASPANCDSATASVLVGPAMITIDAVDDDFSENFVDDSGGTIPNSNVLDNDLLDGVAVNPMDVTIESTPTGPLTVNSDGTVSVAAGADPGTYSVDYTICENADPDNCDTATVIVLVSEVIEAIEVNQLVTPNGDGRNDFLFIKGVDRTVSNKLRIYNRWGRSVYIGDNYNNQNNVFDGRSRGRSTISVDQFLPSGVYYYIFDYQTEQDKATDKGIIYISK